MNIITSGFLSVPTTKYTINAEWAKGTTIYNNLEDKEVKHYKDIYFKVVESNITGEPHIYVLNTETGEKDNIFMYESVYEVLYDWTKDEELLDMMEEEEEYQQELKELDDLTREYLGEELYNWSISREGKPSYGRA